MTHSVTRVLLDELGFSSSENGEEAFASWKAGLNAPSAGVWPASSSASKRDAWTKMCMLSSDAPDWAHTIRW